MAGGKKSRLREQAIQALLTTATIAEAAAQTGISERTLMRWMHEPEFRRQYGEARTTLLRAATNTLLTQANEAAKTLATVSQNGGAPPGVRVMAASRIIELARGNYQLEELERRLTEVESSLKKENE